MKKICLEAVLISMMVGQLSQESFAVDLGQKYSEPHPPGYRPDINVASPDSSASEMQEQKRYERTISGNSPGLEFPHMKVDPPPLGRKHLSPAERQRVNKAARSPPSPLTAFVHPQRDSTDRGAGGAVIPTTWALLLSGSKGWSNYRHQAAVYHMYQLLHAGNIPDDQIVMMHYDDISKNEENPFAPKVFNTYDGPDVYDGVWSDYSGEDVNTENFLAVLQGNEEMLKLKFRSTRKVIKAGPADSILVYIVGYGSRGFVAMPGYPAMGNLYGDELCNALGAMKQRKVPASFKQMLLMVDTPRAASLFTDILDPKLGVVVLTATSDVSEPYAVNCDDTRFPAGAPCIGTGFSHAVFSAIETLVAKGDDLASIEDIIIAAREEHWAFSASNASIFGSQTIIKSPAHDFFGHRNAYSAQGREQEVMKVAKQTMDGIENNIAMIRKMDLEKGVACLDHDAGLRYLRLRSSLAKKGGQVEGHNAIADRQRKMKKNPGLAAMSGESRAQLSPALQAVLRDVPVSSYEETEKLIHKMNQMYGTLTTKYEKMLHAMFHQKHVVDQIMREEGIGVTKGAIQNWGCYKEFNRAAASICSWSNNPYLITVAHSWATLCDMHQKVKQVYEVAGLICT